MKLTLTGRHFEVTPHLRKHVEEKVNRLEKFYEHILEGEIVLFKDHVSDIAEGRIHLGHTVITARGEATDMYEAVSALAEKMQIQLQRYEGKLRNRRRIAQSRE